MATSTAGATGDTTTFDFTADGAAAKSASGTVEDATTVSAGHDCSVAAGFTLGSTHACTLRKITKGTCAPQVFEIDGYDPTKISACE